MLAVMSLLIAANAPVVAQVRTEKPTFEQMDAIFRPRLPYVY